MFITISRSASVSILQYMEPSNVPPAKILGKPGKSGSVSLEELMFKGEVMLFLGFEIPLHHENSAANKQLN